MKKILLRLFALILSTLIILVVIFSILRYLYPRKYQKYVAKYADEYNLDISTIYAIIKCESNFNCLSVSSAGAIGLMQITPDTFNWAIMKSGEKNLKENMLFEPSINIKYGCFIYSIFLEEFKDHKTALACYNAGRGNVLKWLKNAKYSSDGNTIENIPFEETSKYVQKVKNTKMIYEIIY